MSEPILIATRESRLALWQAGHVRDLLAARFGLAVDLLGLSTRGDRILDVTLSKVGGKGLFVKELEAALEAGRAQLAVHSLKDVPMDLPAGFALAAVLAREDPRDAFVSPRFGSLAELPPGARVGTSSLRRVVQLLAERPDLDVQPVRGNLDTRLRKLDDGHHDALVLAAAGLKRLGLASRIAERFAVDRMIPCAGQGALGIEVRSDGDPALGAALAELTDRPTWLAVGAERAVSRALGGSCTIPLAAFARWRGDDAVDGDRPTARSGDRPSPRPDEAAAPPRRLALSALLGDAADPRRPPLRVVVEAAVDTEADAAALGARVAAGLLEQGAADYLAPGPAPFLDARPD